MEGVGQLHSAVNALYAPHSGEQQHAADVWLRAFVAQEGAWRALASLLTSPTATAEERFFASTSLRPLVQRQKGVTEVDAVAPLAQLLAAQLAVSAAAGCWHTGNQLASALATLAARTPAWPANEVVPQLLSLARNALQSAGVGGEVSQLALLCLLSSLAEAAVSKDVGMRPERRADLRIALLAAPQPLEAVQQALAASDRGIMGLSVGDAGSQATVAALKLLQAWCALGAPPAGTDSVPGLWRQLHLAVLQPELGSAAAETAAALYGCCTAEEGSASHAGYSAGGSFGSGELDHRRASVLSILLSQLAEFGIALQQAMGQGPGLGSGQPQQAAWLLSAALTVLGAAARAADGHLARGSGGGSGGGGDAAAQAVHLAADVALAAVQHHQYDVVLAGLQHLDEQLERWAQHQAAESAAGQAPGVRHGACGAAQRQVLLGRLCGVLLQRMVLPAGLAPAHATADSRDLPRPIINLRREVADTFRAASDSLGAQLTRQQLLQLAGETVAAWQAAEHAGSASGGGWHQLESCLYALNLVWSRQRGQQSPADVAAEVRDTVRVTLPALQTSAPKLAGTALTLVGGMAEQLPLLLSQPQCAQQAQQAQQQQPAEADALLPVLLDRVVQLVQQSGDEKLSRNAATCCHRLTASRALAAALAAHHPGWGDALCRCFASAGGMRQRAQQGDDLSTAQFLMVSVCRLAVAAAGDGGTQCSAASASWGSAASGVAHSTHLLQQLLSQPAAAASAALRAAEQAPAGSEQQQQCIEEASVQVETIAVALEAVSCGGAKSHSGVPDQLPALMGSLGATLQQAAAAATAGRAQQQQQQHQPAALHSHCGVAHQPQAALLQALCRVVAAVAGTPAAKMGMELLQPFVSDPPHTAVLDTLTALLTGRFATDSGSGSAAAMALPAAAASSMQAAAGRHCDDPDWQPAILLLGEACLWHAPAAVADPATLSALLLSVEHSMRSYHRDVCERVLPVAEALLCIGCQQQGGDPGTAVAAAQGDTLAVQQLQQQVDAGGLGAALVLGLLLAAAGSMPSYMILPISDSLFRCWRAAGDARFGAWLREAALQRAPEGAPWRAWKVEAQLAAAADLLSPLCAQDARRFKRLLKVFCGGKKKGQHTDQPARTK